MATRSNSKAAQIRAYLKESPDASAKRVAEDVGCSTAAVYAAKKTKTRKKQAGRKVAVASAAVTLTGSQAWEACHSYLQAFDYDVKSAQAMLVAVDMLASKIKS